MPTANTLIADSRQLVARSRVLVAETIRIIDASRRRLNPWLGISGSSDHKFEGALLQSVLDRLNRGVLLPAPGRVWAGMGTGQTCIICAQTIRPDEVENEIDVNGSGITVKLWAHIGCLAVWRRATEVYEQGHRTSTDGHPA